MKRIRLTINGVDRQLIVPKDRVLLYLLCEDLMLTGAKQMGIPKEKVRLQTRNTEKIPDSDVSAGSRQTFMSGPALVNAIDALKKAMHETGAKNRDELE